MNAKVMSCLPNSAPRRVAGFTLIELMITVAIVAVLGAIALPAYRDAVLKGKRAEGRAALVDFLQQQERYFTQYNTYLEVATAGAANTPFKTISGETDTRSAYKLMAVACPGAAPSFRTCVRVVAVPTFSDAQAGEIWILSSGKKSCDGSKPSVCWP